MKIRTGFVSNSSSSSYVIDNNKFTIEQVEKFMENLTKFYKENFDCEYYFPEGYVVKTITQGMIGEEYSDYDNDDLGKIVIEETGGDNAFQDFYDDLLERKFNCRRDYHG